MFSVARSVPTIAQTVGSSVRSSPMRLMFFPVSHRACLFYFQSREVGATRGPVFHFEYARTLLRLSTFSPLAQNVAITR